MLITTGYYFQDNEQIVWYGNLCNMCHLICEIIFIFYFVFIIRVIVH